MGDAKREPVEEPMPKIGCLLWRYPPYRVTNPRSVSPELLSRGDPPFDTKLTVEDRDLLAYLVEQEVDECTES